MLTSVELALLVALTGTVIGAIAYCRFGYRPPDTKPELGESR